MIRYKKYLSLLILICAITSVYAQSPNYYFKHIGITEGLSQSNINCIAQDSLGYMWFGTQEGLNKYDGYKFVVYKNEHNNWIYWRYCATHTDHIVPVWTAIISRPNLHIWIFRWYWPPIPVILTPPLKWWFKERDLLTKLPLFS